MIDIIYQINKKNWNELLKEKKFLNKPINDNNYLIHYIVSDNNLIEFRNLIKTSNKKQLTFRNKYGDTAGHIAASKGFFNILDEIININPSILNIQNNNNSTILSILIHNPNKLYEILNNQKKNILSKKININIIFNNNNTLFSLISSFNKKDNDIYFNIIKLMLDLNINYFNPSYFPIINMLASKNNLRLIKLVFNKLNKKEKKKLINHIDYLNFTPLIHSISNNNLSITKYLLEEGADFNYISPVGNIQVFFTAIRFNNLEIINELLKYDIDLSFTNNYLDTVVHYVIRNKILNDNILKNLLKKFNNYNIQNIKGDTIIHLLLKNYKYDKFIDILKQKKINFYIKNKENKTPLDLISKKDQKNLKKHMKIVKNKSFENNINIIKTKNAKTNIFTADIYDIHIYIIYLLKKYKNLSVPFLKFKFNKKNLNKFTLKKNNNIITKKFNFIIQDVLVNFINFYHCDILWHSKEIYHIPKNFKKAFNNSNKKYIDFMFINLGIINQNNNHANIIIYEKKNNTIERFDPYGDWKTNNIDDLDNTLEKLFKNIIKKVIYIRPKDYLKVNSFQAISDENNKFNKRFGDPDGFCLAWCFWYLELRLNNQKVKPKILVEKSIKKINKTQESFLVHIRNYANNIAKFKINELKKVGFNINELHNEIFNDNLIDSIYEKYINSEFIKVIN